MTEERTSADVNAAEHDEDPLHHAVDIAAADTVETLLDAGADVDLRDRWGNTPLWRAVYLGTGGEKIVDLLLAHGADPTLENNHEVSPLDLARRMGIDDIVTTLEAAGRVSDSEA
ncbi:MAG TPA: ankyrin repeat domain-containing protein [Mycobacterium sp.]|nr:ankyrin repeat domain-containing protein [Mycobacterium sp.]